MNRHNLLLAAALLVGTLHAQVTFGWKEMLGRVTDRSVALTAVPDQDAEIAVEYGRLGTTPLYRTAATLSRAGEPFVATLDSLVPDADQTYRLLHRPAGSTGAFDTGAWHGFHTARPAGAAFRFAIQADPHLDAATDSACYATTQGNIRTDRPDFLIDLGDNFLSEKYSHAQDTLLGRLRLARSWYDHLCHSLPLFLVVGNHEGELGWLNDGTDTCFAVRAARARVRYYPNPVPDSFFSGDTTNTPNVGRRQSWYSWTWGDALFVVLDPYWEARMQVKAAPDRGWNFTLGDRQYAWLKATLRGSNAKFKFVFCHQLVGGDEPFVNGVSQGTGRGGAAWAHLFEMGGFSRSGPREWERYRPGWDITLHDLFVETGVNVFFHGHDHMFAMEEKDGVVYQECPQPGLANYTKAGNSDVYGYLDSSGLVPNSGHLRVSVDGDSSRIEYVRSFVPSSRNAANGWTNGMSAFAYTLRPRLTSGIAASPASRPTLALHRHGRTLRFDYRIPASASVRITLMDLQGRFVRRVLDSRQDAGAHRFEWDARSAPSGAWVALLEADGIVRTTSFTLP